jgi:hypothetical protein
MYPWNGSWFEPLKGSETYIEVHSHIAIVKAYINIETSYLFTHAYDLFNDVISSSGYVVSNDIMSIEC